MLVDDTPEASAVDFLITSYRDINVLNAFKVSDLKEFSDHCSLSFNMLCNEDTTRVLGVTNQYEKLIWDNDKPHERVELPFSRITANRMKIYIVG